MIGKTLRIESGMPNESAHRPRRAYDKLPHASVDSASRRLLAKNRPTAVITHHRRNDRGVLYGAFAFLRKSPRPTPQPLDEQQSPPTPRSAGSTNGTTSTAPSNAATAAAPSSGTTATPAPTSRRVSEYARLLASLGINGCSINNVNADPRILTPEFFPQIAAHRRRLPPLGRAGRHLRRFRQARKPSAASTPSILSIPGSPRGGNPKSTKSTRHSRPRRLRHESRFRRPRRSFAPMAAPTPMPPTSSPAPSSRTAA